MENSKIEGKIIDFLHNEGLSVQNGVIHLGWINGWSDKMFDVKNALYQYLVKDSYSTKGPASWQKTTFKINKDGEEYTVEYNLDSGD